MYKAYMCFLKDEAGYYIQAAKIKTTETELYAK
jgi:hypothetical protein